jgi:threonine dehydrogenase-like Zn-dependent dehydrogenase
VLGALTDRTGWDHLIDLVAAGKLDLASLITHRFPLSRAAAALNCMHAADMDGIKAVLIVDPAVARQPVSITAESARPA